MLADMKHRLANWAAGLGNPHAKAVRRVLHAKIDYVQYADPETVSDCDRLYEDRWNHVRQAFSHAFWRKHPEIDSLIDSGLLGKGLTLDFACGTGNIDVELALRGYRVVGIDLSPKAIAIANIYRADMPRDAKELLRFEQADINGYHPAERFDTCVMTHVLEHIEDPEFVFAALRRIMVERGGIWVSVPYADCFDHHSHVHHFYSADEIASFLGRYARVEHVDHDTPNNVLYAVLRI